MPASPPLYAGPGVGFDQPFELLRACHDRVEHSLTLLARLGAHLATHGADAQTRDAATDLLRYFDVAAPLHHQDEERHVLPRLQQAGHAAMAARLRAEHQVMEREWAGLRPDLLALQAGTFAIGMLPMARARWDAFAALYRGHLEAEEQRAFPLARDGLTPAQSRTMGEDMARRRSASQPASAPAQA